MCVLIKRASTEKKYQFFISSTYTDLKPERDKARDAILALQQIPVGMEMFAASDKSQWDMITKTIDNSDYYILIVGKRYGTTITKGKDKGKSYTEKEFIYAKSHGIPILVFIKADEALYPENGKEVDPDRNCKLIQFTERIKAEREVKWFSNVDELAYHVAVAIHFAVIYDSRTGWIRGEADNSDEYDDFDSPVNSYEIRKYDIPTDGSHKQLDRKGDTLKEGIWKDGELLKGTEYCWLIRVTSGKLVYKPNSPEDPYDATEDFEYEKMEQYGDTTLLPFHLSEPYIENEGLDTFYVVDMMVDNDQEQMINIRTLKEFLSGNNPGLLNRLENSLPTPTATEKRVLE